MRYTTYRSEGGLLPADILEQVLDPSRPDQRAKAFGLPSQAELETELNRAWTEARSAWNSLQLSLHRVVGSDTGATREQWLRPLLRVLGYELTYQNQAAAVAGSSDTYYISHRWGGPEGLPVHLVGFATAIGQRPKGQKRSPYAVVQEYLNRSDHVWGLVSNGSKLWLLRATQRVARPSFIEWDLAAIMDGGLYDDFRALYRLCHASRFPKTVEAAPDSLIERYVSEAHSEGGRIRDGLRDGVKQALDQLGNGFLRHPANGALRDAAAEGSLSATTYYRELLNLIYRLLFLMVAEERGLLVPPGDDDASSAHAFIYQEAFAVERLRRLVDRSATRAMPSGFSDLWQGLLATFDLFASHEAPHAPKLVPALNGHLFSDEALVHLLSAELDNRDLLAALRPLTVLSGGERRRVNYAGLDVEELGSVYESLLDYAPQLPREGERWSFALEAGTERKSTGSYYTPPELVGALIASALDPVIDERRRAPDPLSSLLSITVVDPACGSGHFLLAAARRIARAVAQEQFGEVEPTPEQFREALRTVIEHAIYGVDKNPLAVDLCKVALWIEGHTPGRPLSFLDHRIRLGDSVVGIFNLDTQGRTVPDDAYAVKTGDDKAVAQRIKKRNAAERRGVQHFDFDRADDAADSWNMDVLAQSYRAIDQMASDTVAAVHAKESQYHQIRDQNQLWQQDWQRANLAVAPFFAELTPEREAQVPTTVHLQQAARRQSVPAPTQMYANQLAADHRFFHWPMEFPDVFARGGFDAVLGNPPWERVKLQQKEWFQARRPDVAQAANRARRVERVQTLQQDDPALWQGFAAASHEAEATSRFARHSGRFPLGGVGDVNTYALFAELARALMGPKGHAGLVVPTALATDYTYRAFFGDLLKTQQLVSLHGFVNGKFFPGVTPQLTFCLITLSRRPVTRAHFGFFLEHVEDMGDPDRVFRLTGPDLMRVNPNTVTCPVFRTSADAELTASIYRRVPVLINEGAHENPWGIRFARLFDMSNDSHLFHSERGADRVPLYEAKMMHQFDHRWGTYQDGTVRDATEAEHQDPSFVATPQYWVDRREVAARVPEDWPHQWFLGFRDIARATDARTVLATVVPWAGMGNELPLVFTTPDPKRICLLLANLNTLPADYVARQKVGGTHLNFFVIKQFPILPPDAYGPADMAFIVPRVVELVYTAWDLEPFARDVGCTGAPFAWDPERRATLRAELDGYYAHLYGLSRTELQYILDPASVKGSKFPSRTFPTLRREEERMYGEYRTERLVLAAYDALTPQFRDRGETRPAG